MVMAINALRAKDVQSQESKGTAGASICLNCAPSHRSLTVGEQCSIYGFGLKCSSQRHAGAIDTVGRGWVNRELSAQNLDH
jgi:hypothetical protein